MTINDAVVNWLPESILGKESLIAKAALILESFCQNQLNLCFLWITDMMKPEHCSLTSQSRWQLDLDKTREAAMVWTTSALLAEEKGKTTYPQTCSPALPGADALGPWARRVCVPRPGKKDWLPLAAWISSRENPAWGSCRKTVCEGNGDVSSSRTCCATCSVQAHIDGSSLGLRDAARTCTLQLILTYDGSSFSLQHSRGVFFFSYFAFH